MEEKTLKKQPGEKITLIDENGKEIVFKVAAGINYQQKFYYLLQPEEVPDGLAEDEALVFEVTQEGDSEKYSVELNKEIVDGVFAEYERLSRTDK